MSAGVRRIWTLALTLCATACFAEPPGLADDGGQACMDGQQGCPCASGRVCLTGLECNADDNCVDPSCAAGTADCTCLPSGGCDVGLSCRDQLCKPTPATTSGGTEPSDSTTAAQTTAAIDSSTSLAGSSSGTTLPSDTGPVGTGPIEVCNPPCADETFCIDGQCVPAAPYDPCFDGQCTDGATCANTGKGSMVCVPECGVGGFCPEAPPGLMPQCLDGGCVALCSNGCPPGMGCGAYGPYDICAYY